MMTKMSAYRAMLVILLGLPLLGVRGMSAQSLEDRFASVKSLTCEFTAMATGNWTGSEPSAKVRPATLKVAFDPIKLEDGTARLVGAFGDFDIIVRLSSGNLHLVQSFKDGPLYVTTLFPRESRPGKVQAVHTRHEYTLITMPGYTSRPEQYYGECALPE